jgi:hypothetical protein
MNNELRKIRGRCVGRTETPSAAIVDSQSVAEVSLPQWSCRSETERLFAWMGHYKRLNKYFERKRSISESIIKLVFIRLTLKNLPKIT